MLFFLYTAYILGSEDVIDYKSIETEIQSTSIVIFTYTQDKESETIKESLTQNGVPFVEFNMDEAPVAEEYLQKNKITKPGPAVYYCGEYGGGCKELLRSLDAINQKNSKNQGNQTCVSPAPQRFPQGTSFNVRQAMDCLQNSMGNQNTGNVGYQGNGNQQNQNGGGSNTNHGESGETKYDNGKSRPDFNQTNNNNRPDFHPGSRPNFNQNGNQQSNNQNSSINGGSGSYSSASRASSRQSGRYASSSRSSSYSGSSRSGSYASSSRSAGYASSSRSSGYGRSSAYGASSGAKGVYRR